MKILMPDEALKCLAGALTARYSDVIAVSHGVRAVYVIYDACGIPIYVGMSADIGRRLDQHRGSGFAGGVWFYILKARGMDPFDADARLLISREITGTYFAALVPVPTSIGVWSRIRRVERDLKELLNPVYWR